MIQQVTPWILIAVLIVIAASQFKMLTAGKDRQILKGLKMMFNQDKIFFIGSIDFSAASDFIDKNHTHNDRTVGHIFSLGLWKNKNLIGVAVCGRPTGRFLDDGVTIEVYRNCVLRNNPNACSMLYGACIRTAKKKGFKKVITFTLMSEKGSSVKAANFILEAENVGGKRWTGKRKYVSKTGELKRRWSYQINKAA